MGLAKKLLGKLLHKIRSIRPPEPYKGKGIRYENEIIRKKLAKAGKQAMKNRVRGKSNRPRLYVFRSNKHIYAQVIR